MSTSEADAELDLERLLTDAPFGVFPEKPVPSAEHWHNPCINPHDPYRGLVLPLQHAGRNGADYPEWPLEDDPVWSHAALQGMRRRRSLRTKRIVACITLFNEPAKELRATLSSLNDGIACLRNGSSDDGTGWKYEVVVVLIQDGCVQPTTGDAIVDESTRRLLELDGELPFVWTSGADHTRVTPIVGRRHGEEQANNPAGRKWIEKYDQLDMALVVSKGPNRRKYSSHAFFYAACEGLLEPDYVFLTDAGTTYKRNCMRRLVEALRANSDLAGVTARQRAQAPGNMAGYSGSFTSVMKWLMSPAIAQAFEFEATFILNTALFSILGMLPVLPGPCQLLRWSLTKEAFRQYLTIIRPSTEDGFIKALLRLAEDRVLSALVVLRSGARTVWVPGATFYYPPEMSLASLLAQRRRWGNGTLAANLYLVQDPDHLVSDGRVPGGRVTSAMWVFQLYQSFTVAMSPAVFADALQSSVLNLEHDSFANGVLSNVRHSEYLGAPEIAAGTFFAIYLLWMLTSHVWKVSESYVSRAWQYFVMLVSIATMVIILYSMVWVSLSDGYFGVVDALVLSTLVIPPLAAMAQSGRAAVLYLVYLLPCLPTMCFHVCFVPNYALARLSELSWGTKNTGADEASARQLKKYKRSGRCRLAQLLVFNISVFFLFVVANDAGFVTGGLKLIGYIALLAPMFINFVCSFFYFLKRAAAQFYETCKRDSAQAARFSSRSLIAPLMRATERGQRPWYSAAGTDACAEGLGAGAGAGSSCGSVSASGSSLSPRAGPAAASGSD